MRGKRRITRSGCAGSSLNVHRHYHLVVLDGVFSQADDSEIEFHEAQGLLDELDTAGMLTWQGSGG